MKTSPPTFPARKSRALQGWTLLELLSVVVIVLVLSSIGLVAYRSTNEKAKASRCVANLRQVGTAFLLYTYEQNNNVITSQMGGANIEVGWTRLIVNLGYLPKDQPWTVLHCPSAKIDPKHELSKLNYRPNSPNLGAGDAWRWGTYGLNMCKIPNRATAVEGIEPKSEKPVRFFKLPMAKVESMSRHVLLADSSMGGPDHYQTMRMERDDKHGVGLRHGPAKHRYANAFFLDGHIEMLTRDGIIDLKEGFNIPLVRIFEVED